MTTRSAGRWYGNSDYATAAQCMYYTRDNASADVHPPQFEAVSKRLHELAQMRDANGWPLVQMIYARPDHSSPVIAYRFASDYAYHKHRDELVALGSSLGRGGFAPFSDSYSYRQFVADEG